MFTNRKNVYFVQTIINSDINTSFRMLSFCSVVCILLQCFLLYYLQALSTEDRVRGMETDIDTLQTRLARLLGDFNGIQAKLKQRVNRVEKELGLLKGHDARSLGNPSLVRLDPGGEQVSGTEDGEGEAEENEMGSAQEDAGTEGEMRPQSAPQKTRVGQEGGTESEKSVTIKVPRSKKLLMLRSLEGE